MDDVVFKLTTVYDGAQLAEGMGGSTAVIETSVAEWKGAFTSFEQESLDRLRSIDNAIRGLGSSIGTLPATTRAAAVESASALDILQEKFVETAETAKISASGISGAFGGLGAILGGGLLIGFFAHFLDETNKEVLALGHLSEKTGIAIESLSGLQLASRELGINFESVETGIVRLGRAQALAVEGGKMQSEAFARIGLSVKDIKDLSPEELFNAVSGAIQRSNSSADVAASTFALLGRGGAALIPIFKEYGDSIDDVMRKSGANNGITDEAYQTSLKWQKATADLSAELRKLGVEVLPVVTGFIQYFNDGMKVLDAVVQDNIITFREFVADAKAVATALSQGATPDAWVGAYAKIRQAAVDATLAQAQNEAGLISSLQKDHAPKAGGSGEAGEPPSGAGAPPPNRLEDWRLQIQQIEDARNDSQIVMQSRELAFWDNILQTQHLKAAEELEIRHTIATLNKEITEETHQEVIRQYEEEAKLAGDGSQKQIEALNQLYDYAVNAYGPMSRSAIHAYEQIEAASAKAAQRQVHDFEETTKAHAKEVEDSLKSDQKALEDARKQQVQAIDDQAKQKTSSAGKGGTGAIVGLEAAREQMAQLSALNKAFESESIANARATAQEKIDQLSAVRDAYAADASVNTLNAAADAEKIKAIDRDITAAKATELGREVEIFRQAKDAEANIDRQFTTQARQSENQMANAFASETDKMLFQTKNFHDAFLTLWKDLAIGAIKHLTLLTGQFIAHQLTMTAAHAASETAQTASTAAGAGARSGLSAAEDLKSIGRAAATAGAHAFKWVMEEVPFPANAVLAPAAAAAAFTGVLAFGALAAGGYDVPGGGGVYPTILHPREMVLPSDIAGGVRNMVKSGSSGSGSEPGGSSLSIGRLIFAPTVNGQFNVAEHGEQFMQFAIGKFRKLGLSV